MVAVILEIFMITYVKIDENRKKELQKQVAESTKVLSNYFSKIAIRKGRLGYKTNQNISLNKNQFLNKIYNLYKENPNSDVTLYGLVIPRNDVKKIVLIKDIEWEVICSVSRIYYKIIKINNNSKFSFEDLENECVLSTMDALVSYSNENICFTTYFYNCVSRHIKKFYRKNSGVAKLTKEASVLLAKYIDVKNSMDHKASFEEIVEKMQISQKQVGKLRHLLNFESTKYESMENNSRFHCDLEGNKSYYSSGHRNGNLVIAENKNSDCSYDSTDVSIDSFEWSELEKAVIEGVKNSSKNIGINSFAKNIINPKTGKPYSRMSITNAWKKIKLKITNSKKAAA